MVGRELVCGYFFIPQPEFYPWEMSWFALLSLKILQYQQWNSQKGNYLNRRLYLSILQTVLRMRVRLIKFILNWFDSWLAIPARRGVSSGSDIGQSGFDVSFLSWFLIQYQVFKHVWYTLEYKWDCCWLYFLNIF